MSDKEIESKGKESGGSSSIDRESGPLEEIPKPEYSAITRSRRIMILGIVTAAGFLGPVAGNIYIPVLPLLSEVFNVSDTTINGTVSAFMFVFGIAPLIWASWADLGGRKTLYLISLAIYVLSNIFLASVPAKIVALYILRIAQAFGASSLMSVGAGTVTDLVEPKNRAKSISFFMLGPQLGPILGPFLSLIAVNGQWRWIFGFLALLGGVIYLMITFLVPETLRSIVDNGECYKGKSWVVVPKFALKPSSAYSVNKKKKPMFKIIFQVICFLPIIWCSVIGGFVFAAFYAMSVTFTNVLLFQYQFSRVGVSLSYICPGIALISGSIITGRLSDWLLARAIAKIENGPPRPKRRLIIQTFGLVVMVAGLIGYGWTIQRHLHVVLLFVFAFLIGYGTTTVSVVNMTYLTECPTGYVATNVAVGNMTRNLAAGISSLII